LPDRLARFLATGEGSLPGKRLEKMALRRDGTKFPVELAIPCWRLSGSPCFTATLRGRALLRTTPNLARISPEDYGASPAAEGIELLKRAAGAAERMGRLMQHLLAFSRVSLQPFRLELVARRLCCGRLWLSSSRQLEKHT
jgi:signal transduction histidine kinase